MGPAENIGALTDTELVSRLRAEAEFFTLMTVEGKRYKSRLGNLLAAAADRIEDLNVVAVA